MLGFLGSMADQSTVEKGEESGPTSAYACMNCWYPMNPGWHRRECNPRGDAVKLLECNLMLPLPYVYASDDGDIPMSHYAISSFGRTLVFIALFVFMMLRYNDLVSR